MNLLKRLLVVALLFSAVPSFAAEPFTPTTGATSGKTIKLTTNGSTSVAGNIDCTLAPANNIRIVNAGTNAAGGDPGTGVTVFVRITAEATPTATAADIPISPGTSIIVQNPVASGKSGIAVVSTGTTNVDVFFTPGEGGI